MDILLHDFKDFRNSVDLKTVVRHSYTCTAVAYLASIHFVVAKMVHIAS